MTNDCSSNEFFPDTIEDAVKWLENFIPEDFKKEFSACSEYALRGLHYSLGIVIRNNFLLWRSESAKLIKLTGALDPDAAWRTIAEAFWQRLRTENFAASPIKNPTTFNTIISGIGEPGANYLKRFQNFYSSQVDLSKVLLVTRIDQFRPINYQIDIHPEDIYAFDQLSRGVDKVLIVGDSDERVFGYLAKFLASIACNNNCMMTIAVCIPGSFEGGRRVRRSSMILDGLKEKNAKLVSLNRGDIDIADDEGWKEFNEMQDNIMAKIIYDWARDKE